jgi:hypothetical protein
MSDRYLGGPEDPQVCPGPPYNATNFTPANSTIYSTLINNALTQPQYPLPTGSNAQQIYRNTQNISFFTALNQQTQAIVSQNTLPGPTPGTSTVSGTIPYPQFRSESQRLMYIQGQAMTAARNNFTGRNPSAPAGVPCSTIYGIISPPPRHP